MEIIFSLEIQFKMRQYNKKGVSVMVGYVLLIAVAVVMGTIVYQTLKTYVPIDPPMCPSEVSAFIKSYECGENRDIEVSVQNNGKFNLAGYYIHISNIEDSEIATFDLSPNVISGGIGAGGAVMFVTSSDNAISPGETVTTTFNLEGFEGEITLIEVIPARFQEIEGRQTFVSCGDAKVQEKISGCIIPDCVDSDGGSMINLAGTCYNSLGTYEDECVGTSSIREYICNVNNLCVSNQITCVPPGTFTCSDEPGYCRAMAA